jgi:hypothetical protein
VRFGFLNRAYSTLVIYMNRTNVQREYKTQPSDLTGVPVSDNRRNRTGNVVPIRKRSKKQKNTDNNPFHETMDENFSKQYTNPVNPNINRIVRTYAPASENQYRTRNVSQVRKKINYKNTAAYKAGKAFGRVRVSAINMWAGSWAMFWYLSFQLPFALISTVGLGMAGAVYVYIKESSLGFALPAIEGAITYTSSQLNAIIQWALSLFGINFDPVTLFIVPFALVFLLCTFQLILVWTIYSLSGIKSLSGERSGVKNIMFLIAGVGVVIPILNLLPLIFLWMVVVWRYPK